MKTATVSEPFQKQIKEKQVSKYLVIRIKIPNIKIPSWFIPTLQILGFIVFVSLANGIIGI